MIEARKQRAEISQYLRDVNYWNTTRGVSDGMIDPDPDGLMERLAHSLDEMIEAENQRRPKWCRHISMNSIGQWCYNGMYISGWHFCPKCATPCPE